MIGHVEDRNSASAIDGERDHATNCYCYDTGSLLASLWISAVARVMTKILNVHATQREERDQACFALPNESQHAQERNRCH